MKTITKTIKSIAMLLVMFWLSFSAKAQVTIPTNDLVWEYKLENNLNETSDSSFNTGALTASGSNHSFVTGSTPNLSNNTTSAVQLSGDNLSNTQNVTFASNVKLFTLSFWVKLPQNFTSYAEIIRVKDLGSNNYIRVLASSGLLMAHLNSSSFGTTDMTANTSIANVADNSWHHIAVKGTYWAAGQKYYNQLYVDGVKVNQRYFGAPTLNNIFVFGGTDITIGSGTSTNDVQIDNIRFYKRDIPGAEITTLYDERNQQAACTNIVNIPDANLKNALLAHGTTITGYGISTIDTNGDGEICESEAQAYTGTIRVSSSFIYDATGVEAFINASALFCTNNQLTSLDVSANTALTALQCNHNQLTSLDVSGNSNLIYLTCYNNQLTSLNIANGNNTNMSHMLAQANPNLTCIQTDANIVGTNPSNWLKNTTASYSDNCSLGTGETEIFDGSIMFYPNPVIDLLHISSKYTIEKVSIFDMNGTLLKEINGVSSTMNLKALPSGIYLFKVYTNQGVETIKILKQ